MKSKQSPRAPFCLHFVHVYLPFPWHLLLKELPFFVTVISSGYAAARGVSKQFSSGANPEQSSKLLYLGDKISSYSPTSRIHQESLERATAVREEVRHNCTAVLLLLFVIWIVAALEALCQVRAKMCKPLEQTQPPGPAI